MTDPLKSFRGVITAALILEGIVVLLAFPVVARLGDGLATWQGILVGALALAMFLACGVAGRPWAIYLGLGLQVVLLACWFAVTALGILGLIFGLVWTVLFWLRRDVTKRMTAGRLPTQQSTSD
jgi:Protein of unknown function (DUF4233)